MADYKRLYNTMQQMLDKYQNEIVPELRKEIEKIEKERDAAIKDIPRACGYCKHYLHSKTHLCRSKKPCSNISGINTEWEWRGVCEENGGKDTNAPD